MMIEHPRFCAISSREAPIHLSRSKRLKRWVTRRSQKRTCARSSPWQRRTRVSMFARKKSIVLNDPSGRIRLNALEILSELNHDAGIPAVRELALSSTDPRVRKQAVEILSE